MMPTISDRDTMREVVRKAVSESADCHPPCPRCEQRTDELMAAIEAYDTRLAPVSLPRDPRAFADIRDDLVRIAASGTTGSTRENTARSVRRLADEAFAAGRTARTPAEVADWLGGRPVSWSRDSADTKAVARVIRMLRRQP